MRDVAVKKEVTFMVTSKVLEGSEKGVVDGEEIVCFFDVKR